MQKKIKGAIWDTHAALVLSANWFQFAPGERVVNPCVSSRMLLWCQEGKGRVRINGVWHAVEADDFFFLPWRHEIHYAADAREPFWMAGIHLIPDHALNRKPVFIVSHNAGDYWSKCRWRRDVAWPGLEGIRRGRARALDPLRLLATYIVERFEEGAMPEALLRKLAQLLVEEIARTLAKETVARAGNETVRRVQELIESHLHRRELALRDLAELAQCSVSTLRRQFQQALGMPPYEWILQARIRRARRLLTTTTLRIKEVAVQTGFDDPFQFSRTFRQRAGSSPRQFRRDHAFTPR